MRFKRSAIAMVFSSALCLFTAGAAKAYAIKYESSALGGTQYKYDFRIVNDAGPAVKELSIFFSASTFANLALAASLPDWDVFVAQPDTNLPADGFVDLLALGAGLSTGSELTGLSITFDFLGSGAPSSLRYQILNAETLGVIFEGRTTPVAVTAIPELPVYALLMAGALAIRFATRRHQTTA
jgi:hypothetical protein